MATLPSPLQVAGSHSVIYEAYYNVVDPSGVGTVGGMEAARFLKRSGLSDVILSKIWDLSDPGGRGCLDKSGMFVALKLVALVQNGKDLNVLNVNMDVPPPKMGDIPLPKVKPAHPPPPVVSSTPPLITSLPPSAVDWTVKPAEREKYDKLFESLQPANGLIPGNKVKNVLMESKLPFETLGKIWDLADQDKDGMLDRYEFIAAMHLVYKALEKYAIPNALPPELVPPAKRNSLIGQSPAPLIKPAPDLSQSILSQPILPQLSKPVQSVQPTIPWVVTPEEKAKSDALFIKSDVDKDGYVSGHEIKDVFLQSGVPQVVLAHIWALCDIKQNGKLNNEQFALAMWFITRCLKGVQPPATLNPDMIPPSFRTKSAEGNPENNNTRFSNPELDMISKDIEELAKEKLALEVEVTQKEADINIKNSEIKNLTAEYNTLAATLKQLENQKKEAQKRLNDLKAQVDKLRTQASEQAELFSEQESELLSKKEQLETFKKEEKHLEQQKIDKAEKLEELSTNLQDTQLGISKAKGLITQLEEQTRQINDAIEACTAAIENNDPNSVSDSMLRINPDFRNSEYARLLNNEKIRFGGMNGEDSDPFSAQNGQDSTGFGDDPFAKDNFASNDAFESAFSKTTDAGFSSDPFESKPEPTDAFGDSFSRKNSGEPSTNNDQDLFGCDPFAVLHAPTRDGQPPPRPVSPSPALPPKKSKQPPPRPAPPRPVLPPAVKKSSQPDIFGGGSTEAGFADFSDFNYKFSDRANEKPATVVQPKDLDFTDDPFRDYRYEDPFNITFDDDDNDESKRPTNATAGAAAVSATTADAFDPFGLDGRQSAPLTGGSGGGDPFSNGRKSAPPVDARLFSEEQQLAWASKESLRAEQDRKRRQAQEQADFELALSLSRAETGGK